MAFRPFASELEAAPEIGAIADAQNPELIDSMLDEAGFTELTRTGKGLLTARQHYTEMSTSERELWEKFFTRHVSRERYTGNLLPAEGLAMAVQAARLNVFDRVEVWSEPAGTVNEELLVGVVGSYDTARYFKIAQWGDCDEADLSTPASLRRRLRRQNRWYAHKRRNHWPLTTPGGIVAAALAVAGTGAYLWFGHWWLFLVALPVVMFINAALSDEPRGRDEIPMAVAFVSFVLLALGGIGWGLYGLYGDHTKDVTVCQVYSVPDVYNTKSDVTGWKIRTATQRYDLSPGWYFGRHYDSTRDAARLIHAGDTVRITYHGIGDPDITAVKSSAASLPACGN